MSPGRPYVVGLTGGIGSGKSAAADEFGRLGATVVDTDVIAHRLTEPGGAAMAAIRGRFGDAFVLPSGALDRKRMREHAFSDPAARKALEQLLHPMIRAESERRIAAATGRYVVHVVPLLVETRGKGDRFDRVLVVDCPEEMQISRVQARSGMTRAEAESIVRAQASREQRLAAADDVIDNSGTLDDLRRQAATLHERYVQMSKSAAS